MDMIKNVELNSAAQETNALVPADNALSAAVRQPAAPAPADTETPIETTFVAEKEQAPTQPSSSEEKKEEKAKTKKHRKTNHCREDHEHKRLIVTKETSKPGTAAFNELMEKRKLYPDYTITYRTAKPSDRLSVKGLTVKDMEKFIELNYPGDEKRMNEFKLQKQLSELYPAPITYLRNWFRRNYREYWTNAKKAANA